MEGLRAPLARGNHLPEHSLNEADSPAPRMDRQFMRAPQDFMAFGRSNPMNGMRAVEQ